MSQVLRRNDYDDISRNDSDTDVSGSELEELTDGSETTLHSHAGGGGGMEDFIVAGDSGSNQTIDDGDTLTIAGGTGVDTAMTDDTATINLDSATQTSLGLADSALQDITGEDLSDLSDVSADTPSNNDVLAFIDSAWTPSTPSEAGLQAELSEGAFVDGDKTKLDNIEPNADVTDTANVTSAGALMDSEVTNLAQVKAFDSGDYATAAQGSTADSAMQDLSDDTSPQLGGVLDANGNNIDLNGTADLIIDADGDTYIDGSTDDNIRIYAGGTQQMTISSLGTALNNNGLDANGEAIVDAVIDGDNNTISNIDQTSINNPYCFSAYASSATNLGAGAYTKVAWQVERYDFNSDYDNSTNYRYTAPVDGVYHFETRIRFVSGNERGFLVFYVNGSNVSKGDDVYDASSNRIVVGGAGHSDDLLLDAGDYVEVYCYTDDGADNGTGSTEGSFSGHLVHAT